MDDIYQRQAIINVKRNGIEVSGLWPGWDTAIAIINHVHSDTSRSKLVGYDPKRVADCLGRRIRAMRKNGGQAESEEFYEVLDQFDLVSEDVSRGSFRHVTSGEELVFNLQAEALHRWAGCGMITCGPYRLLKSFLDPPRRRELHRSKNRVRQHVHQTQSP